MRKLVHLAVCFAIVVHAARGCCAHEGHYVERQLRQHREHEHGQHTCNHRDDQQPSHSNATCLIRDDLHHSCPHICRHGQCHWSTSELKQAVDCLFEDLAACCRKIATEPTPMHDSTEAVLFSTCLDESLPALPVRSHLAYGVLLI